MFDRVAHQEDAAERERKTADPRHHPLGAEFFLPAWRGGATAGGGETRSGGAAGGVVSTAGSGRNISVAGLGSLAVVVGSAAVDGRGGSATAGVSGRLTSSAATRICSCRTPLRTFSVMTRARMEMIGNASTNKITSANHVSIASPEDKPSYRIKGLIVCRHHSDNVVDAACNSAAEITGPKVRRDRIDNFFHPRIGKRAHKSIAYVNANLLLVRRNKQQHAFVFRFLTKLPASE